MIQISIVSPASSLEKPLVPFPFSLILGKTITSKILQSRDSAAVRASVVFIAEVTETGAQLNLVAGAEICCGT